MKQQGVDISLQDFLFYYQCRINKLKEELFLIQKFYYVIINLSIISKLSGKIEF